MLEPTQGLETFVHIQASLPRPHPAIAPSPADLRCSADTFFPVDYCVAYTSSVVASVQPPTLDMLHLLQTRPTQTVGCGRRDEDVSLIFVIP